MHNETQSRPASAGRSSEIDAAAQAAGRGLFTGALQSNPLVALGALLISPIIGLFKPVLRSLGGGGRRSGATPTEVEKLKVERYRSRPFAPPAGPCRMALPEGSLPAVNRESGLTVSAACGSPRADLKATYSAPEGRPKPAYGAPKRRLKADYSPGTFSTSRRRSAAVANLSHGGTHHG